MKDGERERERERGGFCRKEGRRGCCRGKIEKKKKIGQMSNGWLTQTPLAFELSIPHQYISGDGYYWWYILDIFVFCITLLVVWILLVVLLFCVVIFFFFFWLSRVLNLLWSITTVNLSVPTISVNI